jgi:hypothetical protein
VSPDEVDDEVSRMSETTTRRARCPDRSAAQGPRGLVVSDKMDKTIVVALEDRK